MATEEKVWFIERFARFINQNWFRIQTEKMILKIENDQVYIAADNMVFDSFKLQNIKGYSKENTIVIIINQKQGMCRKIKMKMLCQPTQMKDVIKKLSMFNPIENIDDIQLPHAIPDSFISFADLIKQEMQRKSNHSSQGPLFSQDFPFEDFLKSCILDPSFPDTVDQIDKALQKYIL